jgi:hypothetical protein
MKMEDVNKLMASLLKVERTLSAVEKNGIEYLTAPDGTYPCGGCRTYQKAVREALVLIRSLDVNGYQSN